MFQSANFDNVKRNNCTLEELAIINILKSNATITQEKIAKEINKFTRTVKTRMIEMQEKGLIERKTEKEMANGL